jgi:hypothetical protein
LETTVIVWFVAFVLISVGIRLVDSHLKNRKFKRFPYQTQGHILSRGELRFFHVLREIVGDDALICPKVRLGDIFSVTDEGRSNFYFYLNRINQKHVDFLLCDPETMHPLVGIELDDKSHEREDRKARDAFVDQVYQAAGLPLIHVPVQRVYEDLETLLRPYLQPNAPIRTDLDPTPINQTPSCPKCGNPMVLRKVKKGNNVGEQFWGCSNYPDCRGLVRYQP